jgi:hypothetical protein
MEPQDALDEGAYPPAVKPSAAVIEDVVWPFTLLIVGLAVLIRTGLFH